MQKNLLEKAGQSIFRCLSACAVALSVALASALTPQPAIAAGGGQLQVTSTNGSFAEYRAVRIADAEALPIDGSFDWPALSGAQFPGLKPYPIYRPGDQAASSQGRALVERVSSDLLKDEDGSLAMWLSPHVLEDAPHYTVPTDAAPVNVDDGWYILTAKGRRPLFAWVEGKLVTLGDKSDTPSIDKEVNAGGGWGDAAVGGPTGVFGYRIDLSVPHTFELYSTYKVVLHDEHDERLSMDVASLKVELLRPSAHEDDEGKSLVLVEDITHLASLVQNGNTFTVTIPDLVAIDAQSGDVVRASYRMTVDPLAKPGVAGLVNEAFATFPDIGGEGETPHDKTRSYLIRANIHKVDSVGAPLAGARFAVRSTANLWLSADGRFGPKSACAEFTSDSRGMIESIPALAPGEYELVELAAPRGYLLPQNPIFPFEIVATATLDGLAIDVEAHEPVEVENVDGQAASFALRVVNDADGPLPGTGGSIPQTGEGVWRIVAVALVCAGVLALIAGIRTKVDGRKR